MAAGEVKWQKRQNAGGQQLAVAKQMSLARGAAIVAGVTSPIRPENKYVASRYIERRANLISALARKPAIARHQAIIAENLRREIARPS